MKKVILALAVVSFVFAACNNEGDSKAETPATNDSPKVEAPAPVQPVAPDTASKAVPDTTKK